MHWIHFAARGAPGTEGRGRPPGPSPAATPRPGSPRASRAQGLCGDAAPAFSWLERLTTRPLESVYQVSSWSLGPAGHCGKRPDARAPAGRTERRSLGGNKRTATNTSGRGHVLLWP